MKAKCQYVSIVLALTFTIFLAFRAIISNEACLSDISVGYDIYSGRLFNKLITGFSRINRSSELCMNVFSILAQKLRFLSRH